MITDTNNRIIVRDTLNWAIVSVDANLNNPKNKWNKVRSYKEYLSDALNVMEMTEETKELLSLYNESLEAFKQSSQWMQGKDSFTINKRNREWTIFKNNNFYMGHQSKDRVQTKLLEFFIKTDVLNGTTIEQSLKIQMQGVKDAKA